MLDWAIYGMIILGVALMNCNIFGFMRFVREVQNLKSWKRNNKSLYFPIALLFLFLIGYIVVGLFGKPDLVVAGILFGGSIFVFFMYRMLDSTVMKIIEDEKLEAELMAAEESNRTKTNFLSSISHEMRTPMNVIIGLDALALNDPQINAQTRDYLERIGLSAKHLLGLINNILDLNRIETGARKAKSVTFSLLDEINQIGAIVQSRCEEKGLQYRLVGAEQMEGDYSGDVTMLKSILLSLFDNAVKYTDAPGNVELSVSSEDDGDGIRLFHFAVKDTGVGMDEEFLEKVFDVFTQEDASMSSRFGGSGLGLAIVRRLVELMDGTIVVESKKGVGSTFTVTVPLSCAAENSPALTMEEASVSLEGRRVLIVEDMPENAEIVADLLELEGVQTEHAENGQIALDMLNSAEPGHFDAVLMDLRMPVMDGLEATRRIRAMERGDLRRIPIIALTANAFDTDIRNSMEAGMDAHLAKPTDVEILYGTLKKLIKRNIDREKK